MCLKQMKNNLRTKAKREREREIAIQKKKIGINTFNRSLDMVDWLAVFSLPDQMSDPDALGSEHCDDVEHLETLVGARRVDFVSCRYLGFSTNNKHFFG